MCAIEEKNIETLEQVVGGTGTTGMTDEERLWTLIRLNLTTFRHQGMKKKNAIDYIVYNSKGTITREQVKPLVDEIWATVSIGS